jgi:hypothetical protein
MSQNGWWCEKLARRRACVGRSDRRSEQRHPNRIHPDGPMPVSTRIGSNPVARTVENSGSSRDIQGT